MLNTSKTMFKMYGVRGRWETVPTRSFFWYDRWFGGVPLCVWFHRLFKLVENKFSKVTSMFVLGWEEGVRRGGGGHSCGRGRKSY